jgi:hypothetical protein
MRLLLLQNYNAFHNFGPKDIFEMGSNQTRQLADSAQQIKTSIIL